MQILHLDKMCPSGLTYQITTRWHHRMETCFYVRWKKWNIKQHRSWWCIEFHASTSCGWLQWRQVDRLLCVCSLDHRFGHSGNTIDNKPIATSSLWYLSSIKINRRNRAQTSKCAVPSHPSRIFNKMTTEMSS